MNNILVTGAGGFIGGWVVELAYIDGFGRVRAGIRRWNSGARIARFPVEIVLCNVLDRKQVHKAMEGIDTVVHCAFGDKETTVKGTENVLSIALEHGVKRVVHLSTIDVYGNVEGTIDESFPCRQTGSEYGDSKIEAERLCWEHLEKELPVTILRPTIVYGPYCKLWIEKFAQRMRSGRWGVLKGNGEGYCNLVYVTDLVQAIFACIESDRSVGNAFNISGPEIRTWNNYFVELNEILGLPRLSEISNSSSRLRSTVTSPLKSSARYMLSHYGDTISRLYQKSEYAKRFLKEFEGVLQSTPGNGELDMFRRKAKYETQKAAELLAYDPIVPVSKGIRMSVQWLFHETLWCPTGNGISFLS
jgi:nucleoside-diphosphate-sugar epimerase